MPSSEAILSGLGTIANDWRALAIVWHVLLGTLGVALVVGWRPSDRLIACLVATPSCQFPSWRGRRATFAGVVAVGSDRTQSCDVGVAQL